MAAAKHPVKIDQGAPTSPALGLCWCGARFLHTDRLGAHERLALHEVRSHPEVRSAREALRQYRRRNGVT